MSVLSVFVAVCLAAVVFTISLVAITYASAWIADVTGVFRLLFIRQPYRRAFQAVRWGAAGLTALAMLATLD